ncbi:hypothetical protein [Agrobacterium tumefaciens]|uniref:hypothetical protein n=1 Tax=Agrobacterium tumefaciens TaxID=358 RepID=UPI0015737FAC|nr:hypothetical protein [Agrobacterium tumefaciens]
MQTTFTIIQPDGAEEVHTVELPEQPEFKQLAAVIQPILGKNRDMERINVFWQDRYACMFVDDMGVLDDLPLNAKATEIYNNNLRVHNPELHAELGVNPIHGVAILFDRRVWF